MKYHTLGSNECLMRQLEVRMGFPKMYFLKQILRVIIKRC